VAHVRVEVHLLFVPGGKGVIVRRYIGVRRAGLILEADICDDGTGDARSKVFGVKIGQESKH